MSNSIHEHLLDVKSLDLNTNGQFILIPCVIRLPSELFIVKKKQMIEWYNVFVTNTILLFDRTHAHLLLHNTEFTVRFTIVCLLILNVPFTCNMA